MVIGMRRILSMWALLLTLTSTAAYGWTATAHQAVAEVAEERASQRAKRAQGYLMGATVRLPDVAAWADEVIADRPETEAWHSITIPRSAENVDLKRDCPVGDCVTIKIREFEGIVRLAVKDKEERREAYRFLINLAADLHLPPNAGFPPDEAEEAFLLIDGQTVSVSEWWNTEALKEFDQATLAAKIRERITPEKAQAWTRGTLRDWTWDTHRIARAMIYGVHQGSKPHEPSSADLSAMEDLAIEQLAKSAVRLAYLLDRIWPS